MRSSYNPPSTSPSPMPPPIAEMTGAVFTVNPEEEIPSTISVDPADIASNENHKTIIMHIISQLKEGKDLTKVIIFSPHISHFFVP